MVQSQCFVVLSLSHKLNTTVEQAPVLPFQGRQWLGLADEEDGRNENSQNRHEETHKGCHDPSDKERRRKMDVAGATRRRGVPGRPTNEQTGGKRSFGGRRANRRANKQNKTITKK